VTLVASEESIDAATILIERRRQFAAQDGEAAGFDVLTMPVP
jgi:hypothetical protein